MVLKLTKGCEIIPLFQSYTSFINVMLLKGIILKIHLHDFCA